MTVKSLKGSEDLSGGKKISICTPPPPGNTVEGFSLLKPQL
jgi:hypothetical protein